MTNTEALREALKRLLEEQCCSSRHGHSAACIIINALNSPAPSESEAVMAVKKEYVWLDCRHGGLVAPGEKCLYCPTAAPAPSEVEEDLSLARDMGDAPDLFNSENEKRIVRLAAALRRAREELVAWKLRVTYHESEMLKEMARAEKAEALFVAANKINIALDKDLGDITHECALLMARVAELEKRG